MMHVELTQAQKHAKEVRGRLWNPKPTGNKLITLQEISEDRGSAASLREEISRLKKEAAKLERTVDNLKKEVSAKRMDNADLMAVVLSQARQICVLSEDGYVATDKEKVRDICEEVLLDYPGIKWSDIVSARRMKELIEPRHKCFAAVYVKRPDLSLPSIAKIFNRDHTTILHAAQKMGVWFGAKERA